MRPIRSAAGGIFVFDQRDSAGDGARVAGEHALGQRSRCGSSGEQLAGDDQALDLARAFADRGELHIAEVLSAG